MGFRLSFSVMLKGFWASHIQSIWQESLPWTVEPYSKAWHLLNMGLSVLVIVGFSFRVWKSEICSAQKQDFKSSPVPLKIMCCGQLVHSATCHTLHNASPERRQASSRSNTQLAWKGPWRCWAWWSPVSQRCSQPTPKDIQGTGWGHCMSFLPAYSAAREHHNEMLMFKI